MRQNRWTGFMLLMNILVSLNTLFILMQVKIILFEKMNIIYEENGRWRYNDTMSQLAFNQTYFAYL